MTHELPKSEKKGGITSDPIEIERIFWEYNEQVYPSKLNNINEETFMKTKMTKTGPIWNIKSEKTCNFLLIRNWISN